MLQEIERTSLEIHDRTGAARASQISLALCWACGLIAALIFSAAAIAALAMVAPVWAAAWIVGTLYLVAAIVLAVWTQEFAAEARRPVKSTIGTPRRKK
jgi:hypothetical protein